VEELVTDRYKGSRGAGVWRSMSGGSHGSFSACGNRSWSGGAGSDAPSWRKSWEDGRKDAFRRRGEEDEVTSPEKPKDTGKTGARSKRSLFPMAGEKVGDDVLGDEVEKEALEKKAAAVVEVADGGDVNRTLQSMHVDGKAAGLEEDSEKVEGSKKRGTYKRRERSVTVSQTEQIDKRAGRKRGSEDIVMKEGEEEVVLEEGFGKKKQKNARLADQPYRTQ
jgi:hypothetical protein